MRGWSFLFSFAGEKGDKGDSFNAEHLESDTRNISFWFTFFTETSNQHLVVFG